ncbi:MAG: hypothetical protein HY033_01160 [Ignavibacteriae bacterium]|nr:hypothetical protein [Ignavibacteria bacterium]MBI3363498.1 hypothetical protein [Ignavibacteriota bacterium]
MKQRMEFFLTVITISVLAMTFGSACNKHEVAGKELVSFYEVPLACGAAPDIGCGSRAKPVFLELENHENIKEAWLNRAGTVIAVVGGSSMTDGKELAAFVESVFKKYDVEAIYVVDKNRREELMSDFRAEGKWYKGVDVDKLSLEEAGLLAEKAVKFARDAKLVDEQEAAAIGFDVNDYLKKDLVKVRTCDELCASEEERHDKVYDIYMNHIGKLRAEKVRRMYEELQSNARQND